MKLALHSSSFFSSAIQQDLRPDGGLSGQAFVMPGPACTGRGQRPSQQATSMSSEIQAVGQTEPMCRIETFGSAGGAEGLSDEFIESYGFAKRADKTATTADKSETTADKSETATDKTATTADKTATTADNSETTADKTETTADRVAPKTGFDVDAADGRATLIKAAAVRHRSGIINDEPLVTRGLVPLTDV